MILKLQSHMILKSYVKLELIVILQSHEILCLYLVKKPVVMAFPHTTSLYKDLRS